MTAYTDGLCHYIKNAIVVVRDREEMVLEE